MATKQYIVITVEQYNENNNKKRGQKNSSQRNEILESNLKQKGQDEKY